MVVDQIYQTQSRTILTYSVVIRTLALSPSTLRKVLEGVFSQTIRPEKVLIYIADGYPAPTWRVGDETYIHVKKGMMAQRALEYREVDSDYIMMLDDDLLLSPTAAERMLSTAATEHTDLLGGDPFRTHELPFSTRISAMITSLVFPHFDKRTAFRMHPTGSFSYISSPSKKYYPSDTCAGPLMFWRRSAYNRLHANVETWIDSLNFAYGEDALLSYKATANGMKVGIDFGIDITNLDSHTSSGQYRKDPQRYYTRTKALFITWWRMLYKPHGNHRKGNTKALIAGTFKFLWLAPVMAIASVANLSPVPFTSYLRALRDAYRYTQSPAYISLPPYILS